MKAKLKSRTEIAENYLRLEFDTLGIPVNFEAGQFFSLTLINPPQTDTRGNSRYFGFTNLPLEARVEMLMKIGVSAFKKSLQEIPIGTEVEIDKIQGLRNFPDDINKPMVFIARGIGIAPIMSMLRFVKEKSLGYKVGLIYVNEGPDQAPFFEELEKMQSENPNFKFLPVTNFDTSILQANLQDINSYLYFIKGEQNFVIQTYKAIKESGVETTKISTEIFTGY